MHVPPHDRRIILPLDVADLSTAARWVDELGPEIEVYKVGLELFTAAGPNAVRLIHDRGAQCFLDLKLHDIPNTMTRAAEVAASHNVRFLTVHASAGSRALSELARATAGSETQILAVTLLTSVGDDELSEIGWAGPSDEVVSRLATIARESGITGFVCSPQEVRRLRKELGNDATLVVPGIRPAQSARGDQRRTATPEQAITNGADYLVIGRPIREASAPTEVAHEINASVQRILRAPAS